MGKMIKKVNDNLDWENAEGYEQLGINFFQVGNPNTVKPFTGPGEEQQFKLTRKLPEIIEILDHPWFIGVQFHPELKSRPFMPHPIFKSFVSAIKKSKS